MIQLLRQRVSFAMMIVVSLGGIIGLGLGGDRHPPMTALAEIPRSPSTQTGSEIVLNGQKFPVAWRQWSEADQSRMAIADVGAMQILGLQLLDTSDFRQQPITWFSEAPINLASHLHLPYRYLDISPLATQGNWHLRISGQTLIIDSQKARLTDLRLAHHPWGQRIVIDLDRPTPWQISQNPSQGVVIISGTANAQLQQRFSTQHPTLSSELFNQSYSGFNFLLTNWFAAKLPTVIAPSKTLSGKAVSSENSPFFSHRVGIKRGQPSQPSQPRLEPQGQVTKLHLPLIKGQRLKTYGLPNPPRLVVDVRPDALVQRNITWASGITWFQQLVTLPQTSRPATSSFPVVGLRVNLQEPRISLQPFTSTPSSMKGIAPLVTMARSSHASAAINVGFFNRNNHFPLGAIRADGRWLSGPILGRGVFAWDAQGKTKIERLQWTETLTTGHGDRWPIPWLNTGYVQAGLARYTPTWGTSYTPLTDGETMIQVEQGRVTAQIQAGKAGQNAIAIPARGYLLVIRAQAIPTDKLRQGTTVTLHPKFTPNDFRDVPNIVGAGPLLLKNRRLVLNAGIEKFSSAFQKQAAPRSAIATVDTGTILMATAHINGNGEGPTLQEWAKILQQLGAIDALNLDGGSSTSLVLGGQLIDRSPATAARVHNGLGVFLKKP